ncbi:MAG TPA: hypothetical protein VLI90_04845 [Tepidisphaeraceae bacterium]|nr:hypothetical protein [Tepidisphaeraceae bacterium]
MAVYFITLHAYRSWRPDHKRGYTRRGKGVLPPDPQTAANYDAAAHQEPVEFTKEMQQVMVAGAFDVCARRGWRLHGAGFELTHGHFLVSWRGFISWLDVRAKLKNLLSLFLGRLTGKQNQNWFVDGGSRKWVKTRGHFNFLMKTYLPKHHGEKWYEGDPLPVIPEHILNPPRNDGRDTK